MEANGLAHHVLAWGDDDAPRTTLLVHGYMDAAGTWDRVAPALAAGGARVLAPDMRGFGRGPRVPAGGYYHFADYVADLSALLDHFIGSAPVALVGHSMGGTITTLFAGAFPERVTHLASLEGLGPPDTPMSAGPLRMRSWIEGVKAVRARAQATEPSTLSREEARRRLAMNHAGIAPEILATRLPHLVREVEDVPDGDRVAWRHDPLHRTTSPVPFFSALFVEFARRVTAPVLFVSGGPTGFHPPDEEARLAAFARLERREIGDAGHMMHWTRPTELAAILATFLT